MACITAKYRSQCTVCGQTITPGTRIEYAKGQPIRHATCAPVEVSADAIHLRVGQGYAAPSFGGWTQGQVLPNPGRKHGSSASRSATQRHALQVAWEQAHPKPVPDVPRPVLDPTIADFNERIMALEPIRAAWRAAEALITEAYVASRDAAVEAQLGETHDNDGPEYLYILSASRRYYREEGMSFGVGDESGYVYNAICRPATDAESAPVRAERYAAARRHQAAADLSALFAEIVQAGEYPEGNHRPEGEHVTLDPQDLYGGGRWFVVGPQWIWAVINNGADGDNWSANNVQTGGAGAIGRRVPTTNELALRIAALAKTASK